MKRLIAVVLAAALGWGLFWMWEARATKSQITQWFEARQLEGWEASYSDLKLRGFPNRLDITLTDVMLADPNTGLIWEAPFFQILGLSYKPGHKILIWPDSQTLNQTQITGSGLRASVVYTADGDILRLNAEAETLNLSGSQNLALAGARAALGQTSGTTYQLAMAAKSIAGEVTALPTLGEGVSDSLQVQAQIEFDRPWSLEAAHQHPQPRKIDLRQAQYSLDGLLLALAGDLDVDRDGQATGRLTLRAENWRDMLAAAQAADRIPPGLAKTVEQGLGLLSGLSGRTDTLDLPLTLNRGNAALGPIPLGTAPRLHLP